MKKLISVILCVAMLLSPTYTAFATEATDAGDDYRSLPVEFSDNLGNEEELQVLVKDDHVYANAEQLGGRLGYQVQLGDEYAAIYNKDFSNNTPYGLTTFYYDSTKVRHMLFNKMVDYEAPVATINNAEGVWIPLEFALLLLNSSDVVLNNKMHIEMPEKNIIDIYMDVLKNGDRYRFDWSSDAGASDGAIFAMGTSAYFVQLLGGLLDKDGASWVQLLNSFCMNTDSYDVKYANDFAKLFCTQSDDELSTGVEELKEKLEPFNGDNWVVKSMEEIGNTYDDKIGKLSEISDNLKKNMQDGNSASVLAYNKSYQELDKLCSSADFFSDATDPFVLASKGFKDTTSFLKAFYTVAEVTGYAYEFKNQDSFAMSSLDNLINTSSDSVMSGLMKDSMKEYKNTLETDIIAYSAYNYVMSHMEDWLVDGLELSTSLLDVKTKAIMFVWNIAKANVPFYKDGFSNTNSFLQSMYAGIIQADAYVDYQDRRNATFSDVKNITPENLYEVSQSCYAYLKSCYITRDAALGSLTDKTKENNPNYESTQKMVNQEIADCLVKLRNADETNKYGCYGFLPEDNEKYLKDCDDSRIVECAGYSTSGEALYKDILNMYYYKIKNNSWSGNDNVSMLFLTMKNYGDALSLDDVGYTLIDIDKNGVPELLIADNQAESPGSILDLYTYIDGNVVYLGSTGERGGINLSKNGRLYTWGAGGANYDVVEECEINSKNKNLSPIESVVMDGDEGQSSHWFYGTGDYYSEKTYTSSGSTYTEYVYDYNKMQNVSEEEAMKKREEYGNNITSFSIKLFSDYTPTKTDMGQYTEFLQQQNYKKYITADWLYGSPSDYAMLDIDGDGTDELLIYGNENEWGSVAVFRIDAKTKEIHLIQSMNYDYGDFPHEMDALSFYICLKYSPKYHALVYTGENNGSEFGIYTYDTLQGNLLDASLSLYYERDYNTGEIQYYTTDSGSENIKYISESDFNSYMNETC